MRVKKIFTSLVSCLLLLSCNSLTAFAEVALPDGAVKGLPERLAALDSEGNAVNSTTGEYFFHVENMKFGETYTKSVQFMNLREDESYYIYFYVEPLFKNGEIDLEKGCTCTFYLDGREFYKGDVNGKGNIDLSENYYCTGFYNPGDTHVLKAEVIWNDIDVIQNVDNGHRLIDKDGEHVLTGPGESGSAEGEIEFKWIFFASVYPVDYDWQSTTATSDTGDHAEETQATSETGDHAEYTDTTTAPSTDIKGNTDVSDTVQSSSTTSTETTTTTVTSPTEKPDSPLTGYLPKDGKIWLVLMAVISAMIVVVLILIGKDKKREKK